MAAESSPCRATHSATSPWPQPCPWCGEEYTLDLVEVWPDERAWMFSTCCEGAEQEMRYELEVDPRNACAILRPVFAGYGIPVRSLFADDDAGVLRLDFGLELGTVALAEARSFVARHHRHHRNPPPGWRWGHGVFNGGQLVGVAMVGRPVARAIDPQHVVEVNRLCIDPGLHPAVVRHAASKLYGAAAREARRRRFHRIITYTLESESGISLRAAGWEPRAVTKGGRWDTPARRRATAAPTCRKVRWERDL